MPLYTLLVFVLASFGFGLAVAVLKTRLIATAIFGRIPVLKLLIKCVPCIAFWFGMALSWSEGVSPFAFLIKTTWKAILLDGFLGIGATWILFLLTEKLANGLPDV